MTIQLSKTIGRNFCYAPWTNIHINPQGIYKTCCGGLNELADLRRIPIQEVLNSPEIQEIKKGNPYKLVVGHPQYNPGNVTFDDIKAYKEAKLNGAIK